MIATDERIEQFRKMAEQDPNNELAHLSLGKALLDAGRPGEATAPLRRVVEINPQMSVAYQYLAEARSRAGNRTGAIATLRRGYVIAQRHGDLMPARAMAEMLRRFGEPVPEGEGVSSTAKRADDSTGFKCRRCGGGARMAEAPMRGELGRQVADSICSACWHEWLGMGTKLINELRLDFRDPDAQDVYDRHMKEFLGL